MILHYLDEPNIISSVLKGGRPRETDSRGKGGVRVRTDTEVTCFENGTQAKECRQTLEAEDKETFLLGASRRKGPGWHLDFSPPEIHFGLLISRTVRDENYLSL